MIKLLITTELQDPKEIFPLEIEPVTESISESLFADKSELEAQKPFISCLIWGSIGYNINQPINKVNVQCVVEFESGLKIELPRDIVYDIHRLIGA